MKYLCTGVLLVMMGVTSNSFSEDLMGVYSKALQSDPQLLAENSSRQATSELDDQAQARFLPQVNLSANKGRFWEDISSRPSVLSNSYGYNLSITQPIYHRQNFVLQAQADIAIESAQARYLIVEQALIIRVAERYFNFLGRQDNLTFAIAEKEAITEQLEQTQQRFNVGFATITDVSESQAAYDLAKASIISAENELANSKERLREISGSYQDSLSALKVDTPLVSPKPEDIDQWSTIALDQNPNLIVARMAVDSAQQGIQLQKSDHYPSLDVVGQKKYDSQSDSRFYGSNKIYQKSISLQFNLPIYAGGSVQSRTRESGYRLDQAMHNEEQQRRIIMRQSREAYNDVISGISSVKALKQAVISNEAALESTEAGYEVGTRTTVDVLNVRRDLFSARRDYANSRYDYILASLRLKQAAGTVSIGDLQQINQWLDG